jgi:hypothetical protein
MEVYENIPGAIRQEHVVVAVPIQASSGGAPDHPWAGHRDGNLEV